MMKQYIQVKKIGLLNFWYYDEEEYEFFDGKLLLRGGNGSGKSVTMQSFFPLILDGNKTPIRLDPFGSRDKKIEDYLIGPSDTVQKDENTGYLYMETYNKMTDQYLTIGIGLRAKKGKPTDFWGFALKDGRRIGKDFQLYKNRAEKIPFSKLELKSRLGVENEFVEKQKDYKMMVNRLLFGFSSLDSYDEFINLILQLRSPKLSNGYKPTTLMKILNSVLQPLLVEDLKPLSEAIEEMNKTKEQVELLQQHAKSLSYYIKTYQNYNETLLYHKAKSYLEATHACEALAQKITATQDQIHVEEGNIQTYEQQLNEAAQAYENAKAQKSQLNASDLMNKVEKLEQLKITMRETDQKLTLGKEKLGTYLEKERDTKGDITTLQDQLEQMEKEIDEVIVEIQTLCDDIYFTELSIALTALSEDKMSQIDLSLLQASLKKHQTRIIEVKQQLEQLDQVENRINEQLQLHEQLKSDYQKIEKEMANLEREIQDAINDVKDAFTEIHHHNKMLKLKDEDIRLIFDFFNHYSRNNFIKANQTYLEIANRINSSLLENKVHLEHKFKLEQSEISTLLQERQILENQKEIELSFAHEETLNEVLTQEQITHEKFYKTIAFHDEISDEVRNAIEASLLQAHLLEASIISEGDRNRVRSLKVPGLFLCKTTKKEPNLTKYLKPQLGEDSVFHEQDIMAILESIGIDRTTHEIAIDEDGYQMDFVEGKIDSQYQSKYIGILTREAERQKALLVLEQVIEEHREILAQIQKSLDENTKQISTLSQEKYNFPTGEALASLETKKHNFEKDLEYINERQCHIEAKIEQFTAKKEVISQKIGQMTDGLEIPLNLYKYQEVVKTIETVEQQMRTIDQQYRSYLMKQEILQTKENSLEEIKETVSYLQDDVFEKEKIGKQLQIEYDTIEQLLNGTDYQTIKETLHTLEQQLNTIPKKREQLITEKVKAEDRFQQLVNQLAEDKMRQIKKQIYQRTYEYLFKQEYGLHYVYEIDDPDLQKRASIICKDLKEKDKSNISGVLRLYYEAYNKYRLELNDYNLNDISLAETDDIVTVLVKKHPQYEEEIRRIIEENTRRDITANYEGRKMNLLKLNENLENAVLETRDIISEQDRHLFEDILLNTVGEKIRKRIEDSEAWVKKINTIMDDMQKDSPLSFRLAWKSKTSDGDQEIDTREIVRILKIDPTIATEQDINKLINHFRARIKKAETLNEDNYISYYDIIFDVLDYRNWFYFQMYYKQGNQDRKELTDKVFSRFSGGEKAKTMYIPMFASVYSKLLSAREEALRIVALDEAFAGVDYPNIRELLGIMNSLDLDYIMTSQVLWGDYDTVPALSICELLADKISETVAVRRYKWNGEVKILLGEHYE